MTEPNELRFGDLEKRVTKIEEYIKCCEASKEQQWKDNLKEKLEEIGGTVKSIDERQIRLQWQWPFTLGVSAMAVGLTWVIATTPRTPGDFWSGLFVFVVGLLISLLALALFYRNRKKS